MYVTPRFLLHHVILYYPPKYWGIKLYILMLLTQQHHRPALFRKLSELQESVWNSNSDSAVEKSVWVFLAVSCGFVDCVAEIPNMRFVYSFGRSGVRAASTQEGEEKHITYASKCQNAKSKCDCFGAVCCLFGFFWEKVAQQCTKELETHINKAGATKSLWLKHWPVFFLLFIVRNCCNKMFHFLSLKQVLFIFWKVVEGHGYAASLSSQNGKLAPFWVNVSNDNDGRSHWKTQLFGNGSESVTMETQLLENVVTPPTCLTSWSVIGCKVSAAVSSNQ